MAERARKAAPDDADKVRQAKLFMDRHGHWFDAMREVYKEQIARAFENLTPQMKAEVEKAGAKLAVIEDLRVDLESFIAEGALAEHERETNEQ